MSTSLPMTGEISIPVDRIVRELSKSAQPGFYGQTEIRIGLSQDVLKGVAIVIVRQRKMKSSEQPERMLAGDNETERERTVKKVIGDVSKKLRLRLETVKIVGHFADGHLNNCEIVDESADSAE
jgi:hypothetical protein